jgi:hypothetical protein
MRSIDKKVVFKSTVKGGPDAVRYEDRRSAGNNEVMRVWYGFHYIGGNKRPHFSVTADIFDKHGRDVGGGCCHDLVAKYFPEVNSLIRWHLVDDDGTPMHYIANGTHWMEKYLGVYRIFKHLACEPSEPKDLEHFKSTIVFGALASDKHKLKRILASEATVEHYEGNPEPDVIETREKKILRLVKNWLIDRRLMLHEAMKVDIAKFPEIKYITTDEINDVDQPSDLKRRV